MAWRLRIFEIATIEISSVVFIGEVFLWQPGPTKMKSQRWKVVENWRLGPAIFIDAEQCTEFE